VTADGHAELPEAYELELSELSSLCGDNHLSASHAIQSFILYNSPSSTLQHQHPLHELGVMDPCAPPADCIAADSTSSPNKRKSTSPNPDERPAKYQKYSADDGSSHDSFAIPQVSMSFTSNQTITSELVAAKQPDSGAGVSVGATSFTLYCPLYAYINRDTDA